MKKENPGQCTFSRPPCWKNLLNFGEAHTHTLTGIVTKPTCTEGGYTSFSCYCGHTEIGDYTDLADHIPAIDAAVEPGCLTTGLSEGSHCEVCGGILSEQEIVPALDHDFDNGICVRCDAYDPNAPHITAQPVDYVGLVGDTAVFTVAAEGEGLSYQWYYYDRNEDAWMKASNGTSAVLNVEFKAHRNNQEYRCEITNGEGCTVVTDSVQIIAAEVDLAIISQPVSYEGAVNDEVTFTLEATGNGLVYQWYFSDDNGETWQQSGTPGFNTNSLQPILRAYRDGYRYKCEITDIFGNTVTSDTVSVAVKASEVIITEQPAAVKDAVLNQLYTFTVEAEGENLTYLWEYSSDNGETWIQSWNQGYNTAILSVRMNSNRDGYLYRCVVTSGQKIIAVTDAAILDMQAPSAQILSQPESVYALAGDTATFAVEAAGNNLSYTWYRSNDKGVTWIQTYLSGYDTNTLSFAANASRAAMYMCKVTDGSGYSVWSDSVKLQVLTGALQILTQPESVTCVNGATAAFKVAAQGDGLKYQWYASADGGETWTETWLGGYNTDTLSFVVTAARAAKLYKCVITDAAGNTLETDPVSVTIG